MRFLHISFWLGVAAVGLPAVEPTMLLFGQQSAPTTAKTGVTHWIWKGDKNFYRYRGAKDFGLQVRDGKLRYQRLFSEDVIQKSPRAYLTNLRNYMPLDDFLDPIRSVNGEWVDLSPKYKAIELTHFYMGLMSNYSNPKLNKVMEDWEFITVTVFQVLKDESGVLAFLSNRESNDRLDFVHLNTSEGLAEGDVYRWMLKRNGTFDYTSVNQTSKTVRRFDYGYVPTTKSDWAEALRWVKKQYESQPLNLKPSSK